MAEEEKKITGKEAAEMSESTSEDVETLKREGEQWKGKADEYLAGWQRAQADFENYRKRAEQERSEQVNWANAALIKKLLPVLDDFDRSFTNLPPEVKEPDWVEGFKLIHRKFLGLLESEGLVEVECVGEEFNPAVHDAVVQQEGKEGVVLDKLCKGYKLKDKWLRAPQVIVGNGVGSATEK